jgi:hypothetical protein
LRLLCEVGDRGCCGKPWYPASAERLDSIVAIVVAEHVAEDGDVKAGNGVGAGNAVADVAMPLEKLGYCCGECDHGVLETKGTRLKSLSVI